MDKLSSPNEGVVTQNEATLPSSAAQGGVGPQSTGSRTARIAADQTQTSKAARAADDRPQGDKASRVAANQQPQYEGQPFQHDAKGVEGDTSAFPSPLITCTPASPRAGIDTCQIDVVDLSTNEPC